MSADGNPQSPFRQILPKCKLARDLKEAYDRSVLKHAFVYLIIYSDIKQVFFVHKADKDDDHFSASVQLVWWEFI